MTIPPDSTPILDTLLDADGLNEKQRVFVTEYLIDHNATRAGMRAGYYESSGRRLLVHPAVARAIANATRALLHPRVTVAQKAQAELEALAFSRIDRAIKWGNGTVDLLPSDHIDDATLAAIAEVTKTPGPHGTKLSIKLHPKLPALVKVSAVAQETSGPQLKQCVISVCPDES